ncbi:hypothetical protein MMC24_001116 [Lignoscripta atroalba]|nr:hypothetical protein [Lignoscripta atroalba]
MSISCFVTDACLNLLDPEGFDTIIHHDEVTLGRMNEWCVRTHGQSGLTAACVASKTTAQQASDDLLQYIRSYVPEPRKGLLAGNSVHCDKEFLNKTPFGRVIEYLHYRIFDVSSLKEAARRWASKDILKQVPSKRGLHQAREDILESIEEARFYRDMVFVKAAAATQSQIS